MKFKNLNASFAPKCLVVIPWSRQFCKLNNHMSLQTNCARFRAVGILPILGFVSEDTLGLGSILSRCFSNSKRKRRQLGNSQARNHRGVGGESPAKFLAPLEKCVGESLKNLGASQKTLRHTWCPKLVTGTGITYQTVRYECGGIGLWKRTKEETSIRLIYKPNTVVV